KGEKKNQRKEKKQGREKGSESNEKKKKKEEGEAAELLRKEGMKLIVKYQKRVTDLLSKTELKTKTEQRVLQLFKQNYWEWKQTTLIPLLKDLGEKCEKEKTIIWGKKKKK